MAALASACSVASVPAPLIEETTTTTSSIPQRTADALAEPETRTRVRSEPRADAPGLIVPPTIQVTPIEPPATTEAPPDTTTTSTTVPPTTTTTQPVAAGPPAVLTLQHQAAMTLSADDIDGTVANVVLSTAEVFETYSWYFETSTFETYVEAYINAQELISPGPPRIEGVDSAVLVLDDAAAASNRLATGAADAATDSYLSGFAAFAVSGVGEAAEGLRMEYDEGIIETQVAFRRGAVLALVTVTHSDTGDHAAEAIQLARAMDAKVQGVLTGSTPPSGVPGLNGNAWHSPTARLESFAYESQIAVSGVAAPIELTGAGRSIGEDAMHCDLIVAGTSTPQRYDLIAVDGVLYANAGVGYITTSPGDPQFGPLPRLCGGSVDFWEGLGFTEADIRWYAGEAFSTTTKDGLSARFYDLSGTAAAAQILRLNPPADVDRFQIWYAANDLWPVAVDIRLSGSTVTAFGATYTGSGGEASVAVSASVTPGPVDPILAPGSGGGDPAA